jgi:hypothetical protein
MVPKNEMEYSCGYGLSSFKSFDGFDSFYQIGFPFFKVKQVISREAPILKGNTNVLSQFFIMLFY